MKAIMIIMQGSNYSIVMVVIVMVIIPVVILVIYNIYKAQCLSVCLSVCPGLRPTVLERGEPNLACGTTGPLGASSGHWSLGPTSGTSVPGTFWFFSFLTG